ncbi:Flavastacin [Folsomia candida]|uniref:Flavastacin n=1 Tax=Folsomia candida TaxID=158441 RepID=A0A226ECA3_FOLCA|nr:Flavastacin [Folsomia candida]
MVHIWFGTVTILQLGTTCYGTPSSKGPVGLSKREVNLASFEEHLNPTGEEGKCSTNHSDNSDCIMQSVPFPETRTNMCVGGRKTDVSTRELLWKKISTPWELIISEQTRPDRDNYIIVYPNEPQDGNPQYQHQTPTPGFPNFRC